MTKLTDCFLEAVRPACKTTLWLLRLMLPISLGVTLLQHYGIIAWAARYIDPLFVCIGLPGRAAVAFLTGAFVTTYAGLAVMMTLALTMREATILSIMICICHALVLESAVVRKTGSSFWLMAFLRVLMAIVAGFFLNFVLPAMDEPFVHDVAQNTPNLMTLLSDWVVSSLRMSLMILGIIYALMVVQRLLEWYGLIDKISKHLSPLMTFFGLPSRTAYMWVVGNVLGISYGSAVMLEMEEKGQITKADANDMNYHLVMNHSMLEDTLVFASFGVGAGWILSTRMLFALLVVWTRRGYQALRGR